MVFELKLNCLNKSTRKGAGSVSRHVKRNNLFADLRRPLCLLTIYSFLVGLEIALASCVFILAFATYYTALFTVVCAIRAIYHRCSKLRMQWTPKQIVQLQANIEDSIKDLERLLWESKHIPLTNLVTTFLAAETMGAKLSALLGIWQLYSSTPPSEEVLNKVTKIMPAINKAFEAFSRLSNKTHQQESKVSEVKEEEEKVVVQAVEEETAGDDIGELFADCAKNLDPETNRDLITVAVTLTAILACFVPTAIFWDKGSKVTFTQNVINMGRCISSKNLMWAEIKTLKDYILRTLWKVCGKTYIPAADKAAIIVSEKAIEAMKKLREYEIDLNSDFYGVMRSNKLATVENLVAEVDALYSNLSQLQKSQYNLNTVLMTLKSAMQDLNAKRSSMIVTATGKQEPIVVSFAGEAGMGKTELMKELIARLEKKYAITTYHRHSADEFWSHFTGQQIIVWDDIGFKKDGSDYTEFCRHTCGAPSAAIGAALADKGRPTNPLFIFTTSNIMYLGNQGHDIATPEAYHRRRNLVVEVTNGPARDYKQLHNETMPSSLWQPNKTVCTLYTPIPRDSIINSRIGVTTIDRIFESICEMEKRASNRFKAQLRVKEYYKGTIPADEPVDEYKCTTEFLLGRPRNVTNTIADIHQQLDVISSDSEDEVTTQAVNPNSTSIKHKYPVVVVSGPSGVGKSHTARTLAQKVGYSTFAFIDPNTNEFDPQGVYVLDDITLSPTRYMDSVELINRQYENKFCKLLIVTENSHKLHLMDEQCIAEVHRRAHVVKFSFKYGWSQIFTSWATLALNFKNVLATQKNKSVVVREHLACTIREYNDTEIVRMPTDVVCLVASYVAREYGDEIKTAGLWTLPHPSEVDFTVTVNGSLEQLAKVTAVELTTSMVTGSLYSITNHSHRFSVLRCAGTVTDIFHQAPDFPMSSVDDLVVAFNQADVRCSFKEGGVCTISTLDGSFGLVWKGGIIRMFKIVTDPVELVNQKIDVCKYFNPGVAEDYQKLLEVVTFKEGIERVQERQEEVEYKRFIDVNTICKLVECFLSILSISAQIAAPISLFKDMGKRLTDRAALRYFKSTQKNLRAFVNGECTEEIVVGDTKTTLKNIQRNLENGWISKLDVKRILVKNPLLVKYLNHHGYEGFPNIKEILRSPLPVTPYPVLYDTVESVEQEATIIPVTVGKKYNLTYNEGGALSKKLKIGEIELEVFRNKDAYDEWKRSPAFQDYLMSRDRKIHIDDDMQYFRTQEDIFQQREEELAAARARADEELADIYDKYADCGTVDDWGAESAPVPVKKSAKPVTIKESAPEPSKAKNKVAVSIKKESAPPPKSHINTRKTILKESNNIEFFTSDSHTIEEVKEIESVSNRYVFLNSDGWMTCVGDDPDVAAAIKGYFISSGVSWAVVFAPPHFPPQQIIDYFSFAPNESVFEVGDIVRTKRSMLGYTYWHVGIVGNYKGKKSVYHVQSRDVSGASSSVIMVDALNPAFDDTWEIYHPNTITADGKLIKRTSFDHLEEHAFTTFAYNPKHSNCETWALAMAYGPDNSASSQELPAEFEPLVEIMRTFFGSKDVFDAYRPLLDDVKQEACIDPTALSITRHTLPKSYVQIENLQGVTLVRGLGIKSNIVMTVGHLVNPKVVVARIVNGEVKRYIAERIDVDRAMDISFYKVTDKTMSSFPDIVNKFMTVTDIKAVFAIGNDTQALLNIPDITLNTVFVNTCRVTGQVSDEYEGNSMLDSHGLEYRTYLNGLTGASALTKQGDCGSPLVVLQKLTSRKIAGIHRAGSSKSMYAALTPQEWIRAKLQEMEKTVEEAFNAGDAVVGAEGVDEETGHKLVGYSTYAPGAVRGTKICRTGFTPTTFTSDGEPAVLSGRDPRGVGYTPALTTLTKFPTKPVPINVKEVVDTAHEVADYLIDTLEGKTLTTFTTPEAINGPNRHAYPLAGAIDRRSSAGFPQTQRDRVTCKGDYLSLVPSEGEGEIWRINNTEHGRKLTSDISRMMTVASQGKRPNVVFSYFPKDEVLKKSKISPPNTRGILAGNFPYVICYRRYFLALHLRVQEIFEKLPIKIGIDPKSLDWNDLYQYHISKGNVGFDADAKNWDASIPVELMQVCTLVANKVYKALDPNWTEKDDTIRSALHACVESPYILYRNKIIQTPGGQVSGQPGTAFDNSLINWILCAIIFKRTMRKKGLPHLASFDAFMKHTALSVYGDDMMITLGRDVVNHFTLDDYTKEAATFGITITPADKTSTNCGLLKIEDMTFLKRSFRTVGSFCVGPIEGRSIAKSLMWLRDAGAYHPTEVDGKINWRESTATGIFRENCESQLSEAALHGRKAFEQLKAEINTYLRTIMAQPLTTTWTGSMISMGVAIGTD